MSSIYILLEAASCRSGLHPNTLRRLLRSGVIEGYKAAYQGKSRWKVSIPSLHRYTDPVEGLLLDLPGPKTFLMRADMSKGMVEIIARYVFTLVGLAILAMWTSPIWGRPELQALGLAVTEVLLLILAFTAFALAVGFVAYRLDVWARQRPPAPAAIQLPVRFALDLEAQALAHDEALADDDPGHADGWKYAVTKFALLGNLEGFGWRSMCRFVGREDWQTLSGLLIGAEVLTPPRGNRAPAWGGGWSYSKFRMAVKYDRLGLPFPAGDHPPPVSW